MNFGQIVRPGPTRQSVEFTYIVAAATLIMPSAAFRWPGVMMIMAPTPMKTEFPEAGTLVQGRPAGPPAVAAFGGTSMLEVWIKMWTCIPSRQGWN